MSEVSSLAETKAHLSELVARVGDQHERITVTVHGRPVAAMLTALGEADAELDRGEGENQSSLAAAMRARRAQQ
jgi:prevent-host-death family protein